MKRTKLLGCIAAALLSTGALAQNNDVDIEKTVKTTHLLAEQGDADAQCALGYCYIIGNGVEQSYSKAAKWYRLAAEQGDADAQYALGVCYDNGDGVEQSYTEAVKWYKKAAEQGHENAKKELDFMEF